MKIKKLIIFLLLLCAASFLLYMIIDFKDDKGNNAIITRGQFAKSIALCLFSQEELISSDSEWYVPYMNKLYENQYITQEDMPLTEDSADKDLTYGELENVIKKLNGDSEDISKLITDFKEKDKVKFTDFAKVYELLIQKLDTGKTIQKQMMIIVQEDGESVHTTIGDMSAKGLKLGDYEDTQVEAYVKDKEILFISSTSGTDVLYPNVYVENYEDGKISVFIEGAHREFKIKGVEESIKGSIVDLKLEDKKIIKISIKKDFITGKVLAIDETGVEIEKYAKLEFTSDFKVYRGYGSIGMQSPSKILVGYDVANFIVADGKICAAVILKDIEAENIRVLIKNSDYSSLTHNSVTISCNGSFTLTYGESTETYEAGQEVELTPGSNYLTNGRVKIQPVDPASKLSLLSVSRAYGTPYYRGSMEAAVSGGGIVLINELPLEEYLYSVVPSEMPTSYGLEALHVQAVCARTYAYRQLLNNAYSQYGAHVDDSISYQVYNNVEENDLSVEAVKDTYGKILTYEGEVIEAYFFSTSSGSTTDSTVWGNESLPYIKGRLLTKENTSLDLTDNAVFDTFIRQKYDTYDSSFPWYRWDCTISIADLTESINKNIAKRYQLNKDNILTKAGDGNYVSTSINSIGSLQKMEVKKREAGGVISQLILYGSEKTVLVKTESNIRNLISVYGIDINKNDGSVTSTSTSLPSAYFSLEEVNGEGYKFIGGGFGHGVGLSQNAAKKMAEEGMPWEEILKYFYNNVEVTDI